MATRTSAARAQSVGEQAVIQRPDSSDDMVHGALVDVRAQLSGSPIALPARMGVSVTEGVGGFAQVCSTIARQLAVAKIMGDAAKVKACEEQFAKYQQCDPGWLEIAEKYAQFQLQIQLNKGKVPYVLYNDIDDFVIDLPLNDGDNIGFVGDWGTGQDEAKKVLAQLSRKELKAVIHLGDIYYSCTDFEVQNYFLQIWQTYFDIKQVSSFSLSGNHDMYGGGGPYYTLLKTLGQPASYCCIRTLHWQFVLMDTGLHDRTPAGTDPTYLEDTEVAWIKRRIATADGRKTVLLSHHQLFSRYSSIIDPPPSGQLGMAINARLQQQLVDILPQVTLWLWGHEHDFVVYEKQCGVLARCVGSGAVPVLTSPPPVIKHPEIGANDAIRPGAEGDFFTHGYAVMQLQGANATVSYYQDTDEDNPMWVDNL
ncbi:MAG TPA: metallophosphoesterase [Acidisarcina sp.]